MTQPASTTPGLAGIEGDVLGHAATRSTAR